MRAPHMAKRPSFSVAGLVSKLLLNCFLLSLVVGCVRHNHAPVEDLQKPRAVMSGYHTVRPGETLFAIAFRYGRSYQDLARINGIPRPYIIKPGERISLVSRVPRNASRPTRRHTTPTPAARTNEKVASITKVSKWRWPLKGKVTGQFGVKGNKGIDISVGGDPAVRAAAAGVVVYAGDGLKGYGNLLIIQHNATYLSAYAHNTRLLVREKRSVKAGEKIAEIASTGAQKGWLHFEIRRNGQPVDPLKYLPRG